MPRWENNMELQEFKLENYSDFKRSMFIQASAGTGKTYTITGILQKLLANKIAELKEILVVTYTEKAAGELRDRIREACPDEDIDNELMGRKGLNTYLMSSIIRAKEVGLNVDVHFIPMKPNYREFPNIIECLEIAGVKNISVLNFVPQGRGRQNQNELMLNQEELREFEDILKREQKKYDGNIRIGIPLNGKMSHMCIAGTEKLDIKYDGTVLPCPAFKE